MLSGDELAEVVAKAAADPSAYPGLALHYERGHELSGVTSFELRPDGSYVLRSTNARTQRTSTFEGRLDELQRGMLLRAMDASRLLEVESSTRPIGDDELPVIVEVGYESARHELRIWADDAAAHPSFHRFEQELWALIGDTSEGALQAPPGVAH